MASRKKKVAGPIVPLVAYSRINYECRRCETLFVSPSGPEPFCEPCREVLASTSAPTPEKP